MQSNEQILLETSNKLKSKATNKKNDKKHRQWGYFWLAAFMIDFSQQLDERQTVKSDE